MRQLILIYSIPNLQKWISAEIKLVNIFLHIGNRGIGCIIDWLFEIFMIRQPPTFLKIALISKIDN